MFVLKFFAVLKYFLSFRILEQLALVLKTRFCPENFQAGGRQSPVPRLVRRWAYGVEDESTIFCIAWKMTISKRHK